MEWRNHDSRSLPADLPVCLVTYVVDDCLTFPLPSLNKNTFARTVCDSAVLAKARRRRLCGYSLFLASLSLSPSLPPALSLSLSSSPRLKGLVRPPGHQGPPVCHGLLEGSESLSLSLSLSIQRVCVHACVSPLSLYIHTVYIYTHQMSRHVSVCKPLYSFTESCRKSHTQIGRIGTNTNVAMLSQHRHRDDFCRER